MQLLKKADVMYILAKHGYNADDSYFIDLATEEINDLPTIESERNTGHWIDTGVKNVYGGKEIQCVHCGYRVVVSPTHYADIQYYERFCSHCGNENIGIVNSDGDVE